eukprot:XP_001704319.1 Hypothetical protein GL50803_31790 [Giardia lamblia ATCC 50803]
MTQMVCQITSTHRALCHYTHLQSQQANTLYMILTHSIHEGCPSLH